MSKTKSFILRANAGMRFERMMSEYNFADVDVPFNDRIISSLHEMYNVGDNTKRTLEIMKWLEQGLPICFDRWTKFQNLGGGTRAKKSYDVFGMRVFVMNYDKPQNAEFYARLYFTKEMAMWNEKLPAGAYRWGTEVGNFKTGRLFV